ncbi:Hypothetical_protein [Hexamita inflata]|uniref:Hypothetical_protein n=1 Tax=Hexamita inflata TaxID=28002 RepID=A0AA86UD17_9EUKA|nr:Hypothetical protein HINF_LOCUS24753 [Hexamita inflata]
MLNHTQQIHQSCYINEGAESLRLEKDENHFNQLEIHQPQELLKYPTHLTFVYTGSVSCSKPLRPSKVCSFIQKKRFQKNESMLDSPVLLLGFALQLFLGCSYWAGRFSQFQDVFNVLDFVQRFNFLLEYSAMIFIYEISLVERLYDNHQVGLYLRNHVYVVFCVVLCNIFKFAVVYNIPYNNILIE